MDSIDLPVLFGRLEERLDANEKRAADRFDALDEVTKDIQAQTRLTNGRVTALEAARIAAEAVRAERASLLAEQATTLKSGRSRREWVLGAVISVVSIVSSLVVAVLFGH